MNKIRLLALMLSIMVLFGCMASCGDNKTSPDETTSSPSAESTSEQTEVKVNLLDEMGTKDFKGEQYNILCYPDTEFMHNYVSREELTGEVIDDAIYARNSTLGEKYNVKINMITAEDESNKIKTSVTAGDNSYDIVYIRTESVMPLMLDGYFTNLHDVPSISLDKEWWLQNSIDSLSIANKLYYANSYANMSFSDLSWTMFFNKAYIPNYNLENPYDLVKTGKWTFDKFNEMMSAVTHDADGDGNLNSSNDVYGIITHVGTISGMMIGAEAQLVMKDENDIPYLTSYSSSSEKLIEIMTRIAQIFNTENFAPITYPDLGASEWKNVFFNGNTLFYAECLGYYPTLRKQDMEIGLLPFPKYDENQKDYHNYLIAPMVVCVPSSVKNLEFTGFVLEAMSRESYQGGLYDAYFETTLGTKLINDKESKDILKVIIDSCTYDLSEIYGVNTILGKLGSNGGKVKASDYDNLASSMAKYETSQKKGMDKLINGVNELP